MRREDSQNHVAIVVGKDEMVTDTARRIVHIYLPEILDRFLRKNRGYRKVTNNLGAKGVFPDINRKVGALEARVWDGDPTPEGAEPTVEIIDDLLGHLLLMRDMLIQEDVGEDDEKSDDTWVDDGPDEVPEHHHVLNDLGNCIRCGHPHVGKSQPRVQIVCWKGCPLENAYHWHEWHAPGQITTHNGEAPDGTRFVDHNGTFINMTQNPLWRMTMRSERLGNVATYVSIQDPGETRLVVEKHEQVQPFHTGDLLPDALDADDDDAEDDGDLMPENQHDRADRLSREAHGWTR